MTTTTRETLDGLSIGGAGSVSAPHDCHESAMGDPATVAVVECCTGWERAWAALAATGRDLDDWMLMYATRAAVPGGLRWSFKHYDTREYVHLPAHS